MGVNLTPEAITAMCTMCRDDFCGDDEYKPVLQVIEVKLVSRVWGDDIEKRWQRYKLSLSDGSHYQHGFIGSEMEALVHSGRLQKGSAVKLTHYVVKRVFDRKLIVISDLYILLDKCELIGEPVPLPNKCTCTTYCDWAFFYGSSKLPDGLDWNTLKAKRDVALTVFELARFDLNKAQADYLAFHPDEADMTEGSYDSLTWNILKAKRDAALADFELAKFNLNKVQTAILELERFDFNKAQADFKKLDLNTNLGYEGLIVSN